jgi:shikimate dehydrogenase
MKIKNIVGLIGWPVSHSVSPAMQNAAFIKLNLDSWCYVPMGVEKFPYIRLKEAILGLRALSFKGANITVPYKEAVIPYLDRLTDSARAIGATNTISINSEGRLIGHNTDGQGFIKDLEENNIDVGKMSALILGAGGSARAIAYALLDQGCENITILNRTKTKADDVANLFKSIFIKANIETGPLDSETMRKIPHPDLIINCTSVGMLGSESDSIWDENINFSKSQVVYDLIYNPVKTKLLLQAENAGAKALNGLGMLIHQGALAFKIWTGLDAPLDAMKEAATKEMAIISKVK